MQNASETTTHRLVVLSTLIIQLSTACVRLSRIGKSMGSWECAGHERDGATELVAGNASGAGALGRSHHRRRSGYGDSRRRGDVDADLGGVARRGGTGRQCDRGT